jgi:GNAT superfamily N-acetyltransferase
MGINNRRAALAKHFECRPLTRERWADFEELFGSRGACGGCWCMTWRLPRKEFNALKGEGNRQAMKALVESGVAPGLLGYLDGRPVGWCSLGPREQFPALARSRVLQPVDDRPCWSVSCLFVRRSCRNRGVATLLLGAAVEYVRDKGVFFLEGYPVEPWVGKPIPAAFAWTGVPKVFAANGFREVLRRSSTRPIMRFDFRSRAKSGRRAGEQDIK